MLLCGIELYTGDQLGRFFAASHFQRLYYTYFGQAIRTASRERSWPLPKPMAIGFHYGFLKTILPVLPVSILSLLLVGCAVQRYRPMPVIPAQTAAQFKSRSLEDDGFKRFLTKGLTQPVTWPPKQWDVRLLTLAAFYFNPDLASARAQVETAQAGIQTAQMRPNPVLSFSPGIPSPYLIGLNLAFPVLTAGKRDYEIELAKDVSATAELNLAEAVWRVRNQVRSALLNYLAAEHDASLAQAAEQLWQTRTTRLSEQLLAGEIARPQVETGRMALLDAQLAARTAEGQRAQTKVTLAAAIGLPVSALDGLPVNWPNLDRVPSPTVLSAAQIQRDAVLNRLDVRRALAQYTAAQKNLQLELARQFPNLQIGPGYEYEEGHNFFSPSLAIELPVFNRNQGPIAQAEARRKEAAATLLATQANVIAQSEQALAQYRALYGVLQVAQKTRENLQDVQVPMAQRTIRAGESDWLSFNAVLLQSSAAEKTWVNALFQAQSALGQLETAVQEPLEPEDTTPLLLRVTDRKKQ